MSRLTILCLSLVVSVSATAQPPQDVSGSKPTGRIAGRVIAADTGKPLARVEIGLVSPRGLQHSATTTAEGRYEFRDLPSGRYRITIGSDRYLLLGQGEWRGGDPDRSIFARDRTSSRRI